MRLTAIAILALLLLTAPAWAKDKGDTSKRDKSSADELAAIGGSYFGTGDEFLTSGVTADPGAVIPESVLDAGPGDHLRGTLDFHLPVDAAYKGDVNLDNFGADNVIGPLWGAPDTEITATGKDSKKPTLAQSTYEQLQIDFDPDNKTDGIWLTKDGRIAHFKSDAGVYK